MPTFLHEAAGGWLIHKYRRWGTAGLIDDDVADEAMQILPSPRMYKMLSRQRVALTGYYRSHQFHRKLYWQCEGTRLIFHSYWSGWVTQRFSVYHPGVWLGKHSTRASRQPTSLARGVWRACKGCDLGQALSSLAIGLWVFGSTRAEIGSGRVGPGRQRFGSGRVA